MMESTVFLPKPLSCIKYLYLIDLVDKEWKIIDFSQRKVALEGTPGIQLTAEKGDEKQRGAKRHDDQC